MKKEDSENFIEKEEEEHIDDEEDLESVKREPLVSQGTGAVMALLRQRGILHEASTKETTEVEQFREREKWLAKRKAEEYLEQAQRKKEKEIKQKLHKSNLSSGKGSAKDKETEREAERRREREVEMKERERLRYQEERFKTYKPQVKIEHYDDYGRLLNPKDAFRQLSHKFHGKESGKMKTDKLLRKIEKEKLLLAMSEGDTPLHTAWALREKQKNMGTAHIILSVGNKGAAPIEDMIESRNVASSTMTLSGVKSNVSKGISSGRGQLSNVSGNKSLTESISSVPDVVGMAQEEVLSNISSYSSTSPLEKKGTKIFGLVKRTKV